MDILIIAILIISTLILFIVKKKDPCGGSCSSCPAGDCPYQKKEKKESE